MSRFLFIALAALLPGTARGEILSIAAASNFSFALDALGAEFKKYSPKTAVVLATGASGSLVAQIKNGAPYDLFLSADLEYPQALIKAGDGDAKSLTTFATGRLVLWTTKPGIEVKNVADTVRNPAVKKLAIANPDTAPYGRAAKAALEKLGVWAAVRPKLVTGENIAQTAQFVETGSADAGFVAMSVVLSPKLSSKGRWIEVPAELHAPLAHGAILTTRGVKNAAAREFLEFLHTPMAHAVLKQYGYAVPAK
jgi:molybdate transport system substrate-binding protein